MTNQVKQCYTNFVCICILPVQWHMLRDNAESICRGSRPSYITKHVVSSLSFTSKMVCYCEDKLQHQ